MKNKFKSKFLSKIAGCLTALIVCGTNLPSLNADAATVITENKTGTVKLLSFTEKTVINVVPLTAEISVAVKSHACVSTVFP